MTTDCSLNYVFSTWKFQAQNVLRTCCEHKLFLMSINKCWSKYKNTKITIFFKKQKQKTICVHNMFSTCSELGIFMYNLSSYCGLVDAKIRASNKDLPLSGFTESLSTMENSRYFEGSFDFRKVDFDIFRSPVTIWHKNN